ncbi:MAG TPA: pyridoxal-phosphate dependent enzyme [Solirubrobacteraceae bacterium]|nr:pyridoxal-phosphate dependent enzyme [Solirubrobacteraceae bacterium]
MADRVVPTVEEIERAAHGLDPVFADSPLLDGTALDGDTGAQIAFKVETLNPIRSFKGRGAVTWMRESGAGSSGVVCASAGNFGQGLAYAARAAGIPCHVFVGRTANPAKIDAMRAFGARVEVGGEDYDAAIATAAAFAEDAGLRFVQDGRDRWIAAGAGTMARELTDAGVAPDVAVVPVGNSALILGVAVWLRHRDPGVRVVGVCAEGAPAPALSWRQRTAVASARVETLADGIGVREPFPESVAGMLELVDDMVLVSEAQLRAAVRRLAETTGLLVEAAGAAGVAALLADPDAFRDATVFTPLCGANLPPGALAWSPEWRR